jgi:pimeloyl-ACP methyl ester carboxylesterase
MSDAHLHYEAHRGDGPFLLLVHGFLSSRTQWMPNIAALSSVARPVVVELFGHGRSPSPADADAYTPASYVAEFERIRSTLGAERWFVCGQSLGAALTLRYALDHPERVIGHIFTNSNSAFAGRAWAERVRPAMEEQARRLASEGHAVIDRHPLNPSRGSRLSPELRAAFEADCALHDPHGIAMAGLHTVPGSSSRERAAENVVPSLMIVGKREERFAENRGFAERTMPHLRVAALDAGHAVNLDAPAAFDAAVLTFIRELA